MAKALRNSNGQGHTYKVGNSYRTVISRNGKVFTATAKTVIASRQKAVQKAQGICEKPQVNQVTDLTLEKFLMDWLETEHQHNIAHTTYKRYRSLSIHHIIPAIGKLKLSAVSARDIAGLLTKMRNSGQGTRSQQQARALLSVALREAENLDYLALNPVRKVRNPQGKEKSRCPLTLDEVKRLLKTFEGTFLCARLHIALICGLRQGEALGLCWGDVDFTKGTISVSRQIQVINGKQEFTSLKTSRSKRTVVLTHESIRALEKQYEIVQQLKSSAESNWNDWDLVFPKQNGMPRSAMTDYDEWQKALKLCGISPKRLHDARHTAATMMYSQGIGIETISRALGHSTSAITSRLYVHSIEEPLRDAAEKLNYLLIRK